MPLSNRAPVNAAGQIMVTGTTPTPAWPVLGGMTYDPVTGELAVTSAVPNATDPWVGGLRFTNLGALYIVTTIPSPVFYVGGLPVSTLGQLFMSANPPVGSVGGWPIAGDGGVAGIGSGIGPVPIFWAPLITTLVPVVAGNPAFTFTRATTAYVADQDGILRQAQANEARFQGARRVRNCILGSGGANNSQDFSGGGWTKQNCTVAFGAAGPTGLNDATTVTATAGGAIQLYGATFVPFGSAGRMSWWVRRRTGTGTVQIRGVDGVTQTDITSQIDGTWRRFATPVQAASATPYIVLTLGTIGDQVDATYVQAEVVDGQSNQAPGDYVSVGVLASPYHGVGNTVDGVKYFATTNGNSVPGANLCLQSQTFDNAPWAKLDTTVTGNTQTAPDNTLTADTLADSAANSFHMLYQPSISVAAAPYTFSVYVKQGSLTWVQLQMSAPAVFWVNFNVATGALGFASAGAVGAVVALSNGWFRVSITFTPPAGNGTFCISTMPSNLNAANPSYTGTGQTMYLWGAQVEPGTSASGYNPTTTAAVPAGNVVTEAAGTAIPLATTLGYVAENAATNNQPQSQTFDNATWTKDNFPVLADQIAAPDGTLTADKFTDNAAAVVHRVYSFAFSALNATVYTTSVYAKSGTLPWMQLSHQTDIDRWANFNLTTGVVGNKAAGVTASIQALPNGWYRCSVTSTTGAAGGVFAVFGITTDQNNAQPAYAGTGQTMYLWGAQVETGSDPSSYVPTTTVAVTRNFDNLSYSVISNLNGALGSIYSEVYTPVAVTALYQIIMRWGSAAAQYYSPGPKNLTADATAGVSTANARILGTVNKNAFAWGGATDSICLNGGAVATGVYTAFPTSGSITISEYISSTNGIAGSIRNVKFYATRLTDVELQGLTA